MKSFPDGFLWGVATSAFQIEGAFASDGRVPSIWDEFAGESGETGERACDHYWRWREDVDLLSELGVNAYRFSIAWPRLYDARGLSHYDGLIDALLERGVTPLVTLYHWDLPQELQDKGGWRSRDTVERFAEYAATCFDAYADRVRWWVTINEPWIVASLGHLLGIHAPGERDLRAAAEVSHHLLLAHGRAAQELGGRGHAGVAFALAPHYPESDGDREIARASDGFVNRWYLDPVLKGSYPDDVRALYEERLGPLDFIRDGDLETIGGRSDFVGVNYYARRLMRTAPGREPFSWQVVTEDGVPQTDAGAEILPHAFTELLLRLRDDYGNRPILITENGADLRDGVHDERRIRFIREHVAAVQTAIEQGVDVRGYFHWSFMDNFEWALGYAPRFGLVEVDSETQARTIKDSGRYYARIAAANRVEAAA